MASRVWLFVIPWDGYCALTNFTSPHICTGAYYTHLPSLPLLLPPHLPSITHGLDTRLLALADAGVHNPLWPLLVGAILVKGYFPLRWWLFRGLYIYGTAAVSLVP